jgi:hypothetical protein
MQLTAQTCDLDVAALARMRRLVHILIVRASARLAATARYALAAAAGAAMYAAIGTSGLNITLNRRYIT